MVFELGIFPSDFLYCALSYYQQITEKPSDWSLFWIDGHRPYGYHTIDLGNYCNQYSSSSSSNKHKCLAQFNDMNLTHTYMWSIQPLVEKKSNSYAETLQTEFVFEYHDKFKLECAWDVMFVFRSQLSELGASTSSWSRAIHAIDLY